MHDIGHELKARFLAVALIAYAERPGVARPEAPADYYFFISATAGHILPGMTRLAM